MKYVTNGFSPNMIKGNFTLKFKQISEKQFLTQAKNAYSVIGHEDIAKTLGLKYNREQITLKDGDELYIVTPSFRPKIDETGKYKYIPKEEGWTYRKIIVKQD
jgi:hypothetical protein